MAYMILNDISMYYETHGHGEPIVFIGGFTADHLVWDLVARQFKNQYQVILLDNRGSGQTDVPDGSYSIEQMAEDVVVLCTKLRIAQAHFVGSSMGGFILQMLAVKHPELVKSATISNSAEVMHTPFRLYLEAQFELRKAKISDVTMIKLACSWAFSFQFLSQPGKLELLIDMAARNLYPFSDKGYAGQYAALVQFDSSSWIHKMAVPTLVLGAEEDLIFTEPMVKRFASLIPNAYYYCFSTCGHLPQIECPEQFTQVVHEFITSLS